MCGINQRRCFQLLGNDVFGLQANHLGLLDLLQLKLLQLPEFFDASREQLINITFQIQDIVKMLNQTPTLLRRQYANPILLKAYPPCLQMADLPRSPAQY